jgi:predicted homoserine dehydrogenase-like protein
MLRRQILFNRIMGSRRSRRRISIRRCSTRFWMGRRARWRWQLWRMLPISRFPPCGIHDLPQVLKPAEDGGQLVTKGTVEVVSCLEVDGRPVFNDLRWGVYVAFEAPGEYQRECFAQYGMKTDSTGRYAAQSKPYHLIGLELEVSVATIMCRGEPTGSCKTFVGDVVAAARHNPSAGEKLDGDCGFMVYGKLMRARDSLAIEGLPMVWRMGLC